MKKGYTPPPGPWPQSWPPQNVTMALKSLASGTASAEQQKIAVKYIVEDLAGAGGLSYEPGEGGDRDTAFREGRRFVGLRIKEEVHLSDAALKRRHEGKEPA